MADTRNRDIHADSELARATESGRTTEPGAATETALLAGPARARWALVRSSGWIPAALVCAATAVTVIWYGVPARELAAFAAYSIGCVTLPGTLLWRGLYGRMGTLAVDAAAGTALGLAIEIAGYVAARAIGVPLAVLVWPVLTIAAFVAVPRLRGHWRGNAERVPAAVSWSVAAFALFLLARSALMGFRVEGLTEPSALASNVDFPYQFALVGELKHHMPPMSPFVSDTGLQYHWYAHAHAAAASWVTGIEPQVLILRLIALPILAAFVLLVVAIAKAVSDRWWPGPVALLLLLLGTSTNAYAWLANPFPDGWILDTIWLSPTQTLAALLCAAAVLALVGLLRGSNRRLGAWTAVAVLVGALAGAKATFLPMLVAGLVLVVAVQVITRRRPWAALTALGIVLAWLAFAQVVVFGGASHGTIVEPLALLKWSALGRLTMGPPAPQNDWVVLLALAGIALLGCAFAAVGAVGLLRRGWRVDPAVLLMAGMAAAGLGAAYVFAHPGLSQNYFARSARPYLALLAALGIAALLSAAAALSRRTRLALAGLSAAAAAAGVAAVITVRSTVGHRRPNGSDVLRELANPYLVLLVVLVAAAIVLVVAARLLHLPRGSALATIAVLFAATSLTTGAAAQFTQFANLATSGSPLRNVVAGPASIPPGGIAAARWVRDNSSPDDLIATNSHCRNPQPTYCDSRDFWVAAFAERRVLVEGWSYTEKSLEWGTIYRGQIAFSPYWDPDRLADNDAVFAEPTAENVALLAQRYGVRWLVAEGPDVSPRLGEHATLRFSSGVVSVYEIVAR